MKSLLGLGLLLSIGMLTPAAAQSALWERCQKLSVQRVGTFVGNGVSFKARQADVSCCVKQGGKLCKDTLSWRQKSHHARARVKDPK